MLFLVHYSIANINLYLNNGTGKEDKFIVM